MDIDALYRWFLSYPRISTDTRKPLENSIFFGIRGEHYNGNTFAAEALQKGAVLAVVDEPGHASTDRTFLVRDSTDTLRQLARHHRSGIRSVVIAITGTNGKTTTKELTARVLSRRYATVATQGNFNNHIGVPLTLLSLKEDTEMAVIEMGANHPGEIASLCEMAQPDFGLITNIGKAHLEGFGGFEGVVRAKAELYHHLNDHKRKIFINTDHEVLNRIAGQADRITYGTGSGVFCRGTLEDIHPHLKVRVETGHETALIQTRITGAYNLENITAAACIGSYFGIPPGQIADAIEGYIPENNRSQEIRTGKNHIIMDAYNANPSSMSAAIGNFIRYPTGSRMVILGEMLELGEASRAEHTSLVGELERLGFREVILVGQAFRESAACKGYQWFPDTDTLLGWIREHPVTDHTILIKGSRNNRLERLIGFL
ncbi:MAG: UDP-N-acetylmuramoyl-tripeptide--D-alanyl-D-alanine ligase [Bacteroidales bacterium]|nr:UDP-N-acetylmuramoyl-tripeptide--D-alanyl-D-alanine ligase [Bacteroidales bacterium]